MSRAETQPTPSPWQVPPQRPDLPAIEEEILDRWRRDDVFAASVRQRADAPVWSFYEGPPTANGKPGAHHVEARVFKDIFPRYRTMKGMSVHRKAGWDCHGLPVELEVERELGLDSKADIEAYGIEEFNARCRESVQRYVGAFEELTERIGFWIDTDDPYRTMDPEYIDSLWWALQQLWERDLIFRDFRVTPYCARCGTGLSDAEVALGYRDTTDPSVFVRFPIVDGPLAERGAALVVWTTTPWTLPSNVACAVGAELSYAVVRTSAFGRSDETLVIAEDLATGLLGDDVDVVDTFTGADLVGWGYTPPFDFVSADASPALHRVTQADFVTVDEGSGIVHLAPAFGADDQAIGRREGLPTVNPVDAEGRFTTGPWQGEFVKDADPGIVEDLSSRGLLIVARDYEHTYPFCWRCDRPLIYWAKPSWYIRTTAVRDQLLENNAGIDWHPEHIRDGRFGNWLENNVDWALSRDRYWGTPLPFWTCESCDHVEVVGSRRELSERSGQDHHDLDPHRPWVDEVSWPCPSCEAGTLTRVEDVADAWFDSGGMPFAQWGYPHRGTEEFARHYPADYICEAIDQTRGWFYTLLAESTLLFGDSSYKTCLCLGHIVDEDGRKMSKSAGNVLDPWELIGRHGADALRWLMFAEGNPWVSRRVGHQVVDDVVRRFLLTLWNTHVFLLTYAAIDGFDLSSTPPPVPERPVADRWVLAELADVVDTVDTALDGYDVSTATRRLERFVDDLSNWYVRRSRRRFWKSVEDDPDDKRAAYHTLHTCLTTLAGLLAPFVPFVADRIWHDLLVVPGAQVPSSVHLTDFPAAPDTWRDESLRAAMRTARHVVELGRQARNDSGLRTRQPLARALVSVPGDARDGLLPLLDEIADELNVREVELTETTGDLVDHRLKPMFRALGPVFASDAPAVAAAISAVESADAAGIAAQLADVGSVQLVLDDGRTVAVSADMVEVVTSPRTGWAVATDGTTSFALDTTVDRDLELEGAARELVRAVNDRRKEAGLALDARIELTLAFTPASLGDELRDAGQLDVVARDVLATTIKVADSAGPATIALGELGHADAEIVS